MIRKTRLTGSDILRQRDYCVVDLETTGLSSDDRIIEIGILQVQDDQIKSGYCTLVNPARRISAGASSVNGITDADLVGMPTYADVAPDVACMLLGGVVVAHNAAFDVRFLCAMLEEAGYDGEIRYIDTVSFARSVLPGLPNYKLDTLIRLFSIDPGVEHRALDDARSCYQIFLRCKALPQAASLPSSPPPSPPEAVAQTGQRRDRKKLGLILGIVLILAGLALSVVPLIGLILFVAGIVILVKSRKWESPSAGAPQSPGRAPAVKLHVPDEMNGIPLAYRYQDIRIYTPKTLTAQIDCTMIRRGDNLTLQKEPNNSSDPRAIAVYWNGRQIGYLIKNQVRGMLRKSMDSGFPYLLLFERFSNRAGDEAAYVDVVFYTPKTSDFLT